MLITFSRRKGVSFRIGRGAEIHFAWIARRFGWQPGSRQSPDKDRYSRPAASMKKPSQLPSWEGLFKIDVGCP
jgi:hypothetical protein